MFTRLPVDASDRDRIGEMECHYPWSSLHSVVQEKITLKIYKKSRVQPNENFFRNLAQCDIKLFPAPKTFQGYIHFKEAIR